MPLTNPQKYVKNLHTGGGAYYTSDVNNLHHNSVCTHITKIIENKSFLTYIQPSLQLSLSIPAKRFVNTFPSTLYHFPFRHFDLSHVVLEITEQQLIRDYRSLGDKISELGLTVALDDFGVGYSNLISLLEISPSYIKLDRRLISWIDQSADQQDIVRMLVAYAAGRCIVIAEGIERKKELETLLHLGLRYGQGFYWGAPQLVQSGV